MKLTNALLRLKPQLLTKLQNNDVYRRSLIQLAILGLIAAAIWFFGPSFTLNHQTPFAQTDKRLYIILTLFLLWLLKLLMIDLEAPSLFQHKDAYARRKWQELQNRFYGATQFLKKTTITKHGKAVRLNELPWFLLIGPRGAGKTTFLAKSNVNFILQRQFQQDRQQLGPSENCDWWVTRDASIVDVPGRYLASPSVGNSKSKARIYPELWNIFLRLIKAQRGKHSISGLLIALPLPEIMKQTDPKKYNAMLRDLCQHIFKIQKVFSQPLPCQLIITKCDLLPGFNEFFAESADDEITQAWGIMLSAPKDNEKVQDIFTLRFNMLIKRLNEQLLWRLHQERNPFLRPYIKDFPLQLERLKEMTADFIKKLSAPNLNLVLKGVYLTSAMQAESKEEHSVLDEGTNKQERAVQLFKEPQASSRAYFIKQFLLQGLANTQIEQVPPSAAHIWQKRTAYALSFSLIGMAAVIFGRDFEHGIKQTYVLQNNIADYQLSIQQISGMDEHLQRTLDLLNLLQQANKKDNSKFNLHYLLSFYSHKSEQNAEAAYYQALQIILLPELRNYLGDYLKTPVNRDAESVYAALKAYLMLGSTTHFQANYILETMHKLLPKTLQGNAREQFINHLKTALSVAWTPLPLDTNLVQQTRTFLTGLPSLQLSYIILKNIGKNSENSEINLAADNAIFVSKQPAYHIPSMFTAKAFNNIITQETALAAQEATTGNWVVSDEIGGGVNKVSDYTTGLIEQLRTAYVNNYIDVWESVLTNMELIHPKDLVQTDRIILGLISNNSPFLQLLQTLHDNTYFEPITSLSPKLQSLGLLVDKHNQSDRLLYQIFSNLQTLHHYIHAVISADNEQKAAFNLISKRASHLDAPDAITQLRLLADASPEPVKTWLNKITNDTWHFLMQEACRYIDISWQEQVIKPYQADIANHYPFGTLARKDVALEKFADFFGNPGKIVSFYANYLQPLVDTSTTDWHWKAIDNQKLPFSEETLRQVQQALRIHTIFFPNGDNKLLVQFTLQPYKFDKKIKSVHLKINDKQVTDEKSSRKIYHAFAWPRTGPTKITSIQLTMADQKTLSQNFAGDWGLFKLINQSFETMITNKQIVLNLSLNESPAKYLLTAEGKFSPLLSLDLRHFHLPAQLTEQTA